MTRRTTDAPSTAFALALLEELVRLGVRHVVLSPGSRSQALALVAAEFERAGRITLHVRIDERVAGFLALGLSVESATPVVIITTSGTAVANLHPAVLEANHSGVPLVVITADRPDELRGIGSNQTTDQVGIFGSATRRSYDVGAPEGNVGEHESAILLARAVLADAVGPVHVNLAFSEPLSGAGPDFAARVAAPDPSAQTELENPDVAVADDQPRRILIASPAPGTVVIAGHGAGPNAERIAHELGAPLIAEVSSGARFGRNLVVCYRELLGEAEFGAQVQRVIVVGHPTLSREVPALISRDDVSTVVVRGMGIDDYNPGHRVDDVVDDVIVEPDPAAFTIAQAWLAGWVSASRAIVDARAVAEGGTRQAALEPTASRLSDATSRAAFTRSELARVRQAVTRRALVNAVWGATWPHDRLVLGASRLIREADKVVPGKKISVHANRGLAGIDGTIATGLGIALASQVHNDRGVTRVLLGDLAALHDVGALLLGDGEPRPRIQIIVGNDGGGTIFDGLEVAGDSDPQIFDRVLMTPQRVAFDALAAAYGWEYLQVGNRGDLDQALTSGDRPTLIEVTLPR